MNLKPLACVVVLLALGGAACVKKQGSFDAKGYTNHLYQYQVRNDPSGTLMGDDWMLDNYYTDKQQGQRLKAKRADDYLVTFELDANGDGKTDKTKEELRYDLRFVHRANAGVIWLRTLPISTSMGETNLRVLMQEFVDGLAGTAYTSVSLGKTSVLVESERLAARVIDAQPNRVGGAEAYEAFVEIANVDALKLDPKARRKLAKLIVVRTSFHYGDKRASWPVLMAAGYANFPEDFQASLPDFDSLLSRIELLGLASYEPKATLSKRAPEPEASDPPVTEKPEVPPPPSAPATDPDPSDAGVANPEAGSPGVEERL